MCTNQLIPNKFDSAFLQEAYFLIWGFDVAMPLTWDQALFSFRLTNKFLSRKAKRERVRENVWILAANIGPDLRLPCPKLSLQTITFRTGMTVSPKQDRDKLYVHYCIFRSKSFRCDMPKANRAAISLKNGGICSWDQNKAQVARQPGR